MSQPSAKTEKNRIAPPTTVETPEISESNSSTRSGRIISMDALRGFDMFWIIGIDEVIWAAERAWPNTFTHLLSAPLQHRDWHGFNFYDLIFPMFIFLVGVSTVFSLSKTLQKENLAPTYWRIIRRFLLLYLVALLHNHSLWAEHIHWLGVLQRIAWCYLITALLFCNLRLRGLLVVFACILVSYWALLSYVPPPGESAPTLEMGRTWPNYIDLHYLPEGSGGRRGYINEGILSTVPAVATCLLGLFAGMFIKSKRANDKQIVTGLLIGGALLVGLGYLWGLQFPVNKRIWTSTYVLVAGGYSCLLLGMFYLVIDVLHWKKWATPFIWIGSNAIVAYVACGTFSDLLDWDPIDAFFERRFGDTAGMMHWSIVTIGVLVLIYGLYRKKIFLRL